MKRRAFLRNGLMLGCSAAASPLLTPVTFASGPWEARLVVIILRGALDGLDAIRPLGDANLAALRPGLTTDDSIDLDGFFGLHPGLAPMKPLWDAGDFGAMHAVSTPYRDKRSHFDGQDILEAGLPDLPSGARDGWLNRMLQTVPGVQAQTSYAIGPEQMLVLSGDAPTARWAPRTSLRITPQARRLLELVTHDDPLFRDATAQAVEITDQLSLDADTDAAGAAAMAADPMMAQVGGGQHRQLAEFAAARLRGATRIASFSIGGWDTHQNQANALARNLGRLSDTILTLRSGLGDIWGQTAVLCMTEFGRTARENGTKGTDHGTGGALLFAGGALRGGQVLGGWPGLGDDDLYAGRDLMPLADVRAAAGWTMRGLFGLDRTTIETAIFPGLEMGIDPGIVA
ncbi:DUF1501 domain-containing protein [Yoonia sp. 208BN28-4]|uniref:DUF1501 domain-containing protein n=1 Tax=Yoonia sp. 208BN28-4 TaxID=3126505 RepID=UPI0030A6554D